MFMIMITPMILMLLVHELSLTEQSAVLNL